MTHSLFLEDELLHEVLLLRLHLGEGGVLSVESVQLRLLLHDQGAELLLLGLPLLGVGLQQVPRSDGLDLLLLYFFGHGVKYHDEAVSNFLKS